MTEQEQLMARRREKYAETHVSKAERVASALVVGIAMAVLIAGVLRIAGVIWESLR